MKSIQATLHTMFHPPCKRLRADPHRKACERARAPAHKHDIKTETFPDGGMLVWLPAASRPSQPKTIPLRATGSPTTGPKH